MDPSQTAPKNILLFVICAFRVNKCEFSVYTVRIFIKCTHVFSAQTTNYRVPTEIQKHNSMIFP